MSRALQPTMLGLLLALPAACACPPLVERWDTPRDTLELWQARLCRDDAEGEYACFARSFQRAFGGFENYWVARNDLLDREPAAAWLFRHADLGDRVVGETYSLDGRHAALFLRAGDRHLAVSFEREAWVTASWDDGRTETVRLREPLAELVARDEAAGRQWLLLERPDLRDADRLREVRVATRWLISDLAGLAEGRSPAAEAAP